MQQSHTMKLVQPQDVLVQQVADGESVLLHISSGEYFGLDRMGQIMWSSLTTSESVQAAYDQLLARFEVEPERLEADLQALIEKLLSHGLVEEAVA